MCEAFEMPFDCLLEIGLKSITLHNKLCRSSKPYNLYYQTRQPYIQDHFTVVNTKDLWYRSATTYMLNGHLHRTSGPAIVYPDGQMVYYQNNCRHRTDGPAIIYPNGQCEYYQLGRRHRNSGPATTDPDGTIRYYQNKLPHRINGPAIVYPHGRTEYYLKGVRIID